MPSAALEQLEPSDSTTPEACPPQEYDKRLAFIRGRWPAIADAADHPLARFYVENEKNENEWQWRVGWFTLTMALVPFAWEFPGVIAVIILYWAMGPSINVFRWSKGRVPSLGQTLGRKDRAKLLDLCQCPISFRELTAIECLRAVRLGDYQSTRGWLIAYWLIAFFIVLPVSVVFGLWEEGGLLWAMWMVAIPSAVAAVAQFMLAPGTRMIGAAYDVNRFLRRWLRSAGSWNGVKLSPEEKAEFKELILWTALIVSLLFAIAVVSQYMGAWIWPTAILSASIWGPRYYSIHGPRMIERNFERIIKSGEPRFHELKTQPGEHSA